MMELDGKKIYLYSKDVDFRKGISSLNNLIQIHFKDQELDDCLFLFFSKKRQADQDHRDRKGRHLALSEETVRFKVHLRQSRSHDLHRQGKAQVYLIVHSEDPKKVQVLILAFSLLKI